MDRQFNCDGTCKNKKCKNKLQIKHSTTWCCVHTELGSKLGSVITGVSKNNYNIQYSIHIKDMTTDIQGDLSLQKTLR